MRDHTFGPPDLQRLLMSWEYEWLSISWLTHWQSHLYSINKFCPVFPRISSVSTLGFFVHLVLQMAKPCAYSDWEWEDIHSTAYFAADLPRDTKLGGRETVCSESCKVQLTNWRLRTTKQRTTFGLERSKCNLPYLCGRWQSVSSGYGDECGSLTLGTGS